MHTVLCFVWFWLYVVIVFAIHVLGFSSGLHRWNCAKHNIALIPVKYCECYSDINWGNSAGHAIHHILYLSPIVLKSSQWRHDERNGASNHKPHDCLLKCLFRYRSKKTSKLRVAGLCEGNSPVTGEFPAQRADMRKIFPFDDVIMWYMTMMPRCVHYIYKWEKYQVGSRIWWIKVYGQLYFINLEFIKLEWVSWKYFRSLIYLWLFLG